MRVHYGLDALLFGSENLWLKGKDFLLTTQYTPGTTTQPTVSTGVTPFEAEPGVNREWVEVSDGVFSISAQPVRGSVDVYGPDGGLLAYGTQWEEADDDGISYRLIDVEADAVTVVYLVMMPEVILEPRHIRSWMQQIEAAERADDQALLA